jgi:hypothetical protein
MLPHRLAIALLVTAAVPAAARAQVTLIDFEFIQGPQSSQPIGDYYNGGFSGGPTPAGPGPNLGVTFSSNALGVCREDLPGCGGNFAGAPTPRGILFFLGGSAATLNYDGGFTTGFSFFYTAINQPGFVRVFDGLNGTGSLLATIDLATTPSTPGTGPCADNPGGQFCPFVPIGVSFAGTARSIDFGGTINQIGFDNITFGSAVPCESTGSCHSVVPEPSTYALLAAGLAGIAAVTRRRAHA